MLGNLSASGSCCFGRCNTDLHAIFVFGSPDRWDDLPDTALAQPGLFSNLLTFSAGPRVRLSVFIGYTLAQRFLLFV